MNGFINNLISRHAEINQNVQPRLRGIFEPEVIPNTISAPIDIAEPVRSTSTPDENVGMKPSNKVYPYNFSNPNSEKPSEHNSLRNGPLLANAYNEKISDGPKDPSFRSNVHRPGKISIDTDHDTENESINLVSPQMENSKVTYNLKSRDQTNPNDSRDPFDKSGSLLTNIKTGLQELFPKQSILQDFKNAHSLDRFDKIPEAETPPVIKVTIGRIDVRAISQPTSLPVANKVAPRPKMSLDDYLKKRTKGE